ncbi:MAG: hypothetical protein ACK5QH_06415 [Rubrivivax sp.]
MALWLAVLSACATPPAWVGQTETQVLARWGAPTARYTLTAPTAGAPPAVQRLEYASGPYGRTTWMLDLDASGRVVAARQVLDEAALAAFQATAPGLGREALLRALGTPGERRHGGWAGGQVWSWRYPTNDCLWFQVSLGDDGLVRSASFGTDPRCDAANDKP